jgi:segregation and condensation protein B
MGAIRMDNKQLKQVVEAALLAAGRPLSLDKMLVLFGNEDPPTRQDIRAAVMDLQADYADRGIEVQEVASGFRVQVKSSMSHWLEKLWAERPPRYSRALLETLSIITYRQPATRGEIEDIRGVAVSTNIVRTLLERNWIRVVGHRDVPGKPAMFGTTKEFLDYFNLKRLDDLPPLSELQDIESLNVQLDTADQETGPIEAGEVGELPDDAGSEAELEDGGALLEAKFDEGLTDENRYDSSVYETENDNVASIEDARAAAAMNAEPEPEIDDDKEQDDATPATVLPLKQP